MDARKERKEGMLDGWRHLDHHFYYLSLMDEFLCDLAWQLSYLGTLGTTSRTLAARDPRNFS
nr:hypothetical protein Q903MT_gene3621 [Picea sitchensis]